MPTANNDETTVGFSQSDVQAMIDEALSKDRAERAAVDRNATSTSPVPAHAGGIGTDIHETWSGYDQHLSTQGTHPLQQTKSSRK